MRPAGWANGFLHYAEGTQWPRHWHKHWAPPPTPPPPDPLIQYYTETVRHWSTSWWGPQGPVPSRTAVLVKFAKPAPVETRDQDQRGFRSRPDQGAPHYEDHAAKSIHFQFRSSLIYWFGCLYWLPCCSLFAPWRMLMVILSTLTIGWWNPKLCKIFDFFFLISLLGGWVGVLRVLTSPAGGVFTNLLIN